jgi:hypothetical protein
MHFYRASTSVKTLDIDEVSPSLRISLLMMGKLVTGPETLRTKVEYQASKERATRTRAKTIRPAE